MIEAPLDPPEEPEPPECPVVGCDGLGNYDSENADGQVWECEECGHSWTQQPAWWNAPDEPPREPEEIEPYCRECGGPNETGCLLCEDCGEGWTCAHGYRAGECSDCDHLADLAFDAGRERR